MKFLIDCFFVIVGVIALLCAILFTAKSLFADTCPERHGFRIRRRKRFAIAMNFGAIAILLCVIPWAPAQVSPVNTVYGLTNSLTILTTSTNIPASIAITNTLPQKRDVLVGWRMIGLDATNTGLTAFQFDTINTTNNYKTTTKEYTVTGSANGTTVVNDTAVLLSTTLGPAQALVLSTITNAPVNVGSGATNTLVVSNLWLQFSN